MPSRDHLPSTPAPELLPAAFSEGFRTRSSVILAVAGTAVGLGNFLRCPGVVKHGGGAFVLPYFRAPPATEPR
jgi:hypothetical protein